MGDGRTFAEDHCAAERGQNESVLGESTGGIDDVGPAFFEADGAGDLLMFAVSFEEPVVQLVIVKVDGKWLAKCRVGGAQFNSFLGNSQGECMWIGFRYLRAKGYACPDDPAL